MQCLKFDKCRLPQNKFYYTSISPLREYGGSLMNDQLTCNDKLIIMYVQNTEQARPELTYYFASR